MHLLSLDFTLNGANQTDMLLLRAVRYSEIGSTYHLPRGTPSRPRGVLTLYAVPNGVRAEAAAVLTTGSGLHRACAWLAAAGAANPNWLDRSHSWAAYLHNGALCVEETED